MKNLIDTAIDTGDLRILIKAIQEADLLDILKYDGPYTIFAPIDKAFFKLPREKMKNLYQDKEKLTNILTNHIIPVKIKKKDVIKLKKAMNINGKYLKINKELNLKIENANIIKTDIECRNGIIHVIDKVLL